MRDNHTQVSNSAGDLSMNTSPWNKDRIIGQKRPLQISHVWGIRIRLELEGKTRDLALFNMALDSKLRGCDLVKLKVSDVAYGSSVSSRATVLQQKTGMLHLSGASLMHEIFKKNCFCADIEGKRCIFPSLTDIPCQQAGLPSGKSYQGRKYERA